MKARFRSVAEGTSIQREPGKAKWKSLGRAAQPVPALTYFLADVNTVGPNQNGGGGGKCVFVCVRGYIVSTLNPESLICRRGPWCCETEFGNILIFVYMVGSHVQKVVSD